jgi:hypothetical protein
MKFDIRDSAWGKYKNVEVSIDSVTIDLGLHDDIEQRRLAVTLLEAAYDLLGDKTNFFETIASELSITPTSEND